MRSALMAFVFILSLSTNVTANDVKRDLVSQSLQGVSSVAEGVDLIRTTLENQGFEIIAIINHQAGANSVDPPLELRPTQVILFSQPRLDRALIRRKQIAALDLPNKYLLFEDENGAIQLRFNPPGFLIDRHDIPVFDGLIAKLDRVLGQFGRLDNGVGLVKSSQPVAQTVEKLLKVLKDAGFRIPAVVNFGDRDRRFGKKLRDTQLIIFGNPNAGTPLMQNDQSIGLDLPQKFLVFKDSQGQVLIAFNDPRFLAKKHNLQSDQDPPGPPSLDMRLDGIANALRGLAEAGAQP